MGTSPATTDNLLAGTKLLDALERGGVDLDVLGRALPHEYRLAQQQPRMLLPDDMSRIFIECARQTGDEHFGLHMSQYAPHDTVGVYGYLLLNAPSIGELLKIASKYFPIFYQGATLRVATVGANSKLIFTRGRPETLSPQHGNEWTLGAFTRLIRSWNLDDWTPIRVRFTNPQPANIDPLLRMFGDNIQFSQEETSIEFERELLRQRNPRADTNLLEILLMQADRLLTRVVNEQSFEAQVRFLILERLEPDGATAGSIARQLNMSVSTLKRRLKEVGLSFRTMREEVIVNLAHQALADSDVRISDIALKLGYSELSSFDRMFARVTGKSPRAYRQSIAHAN